MFRLPVLALLGVIALGPAAAQTITLSAPFERIVVQRGPLNQAAVRVAGTLSANADAIEARAVLQPGAVGGSSVDWTQIAASSPGGAFATSLTVPAGGWYRVEVRARTGATYGPVAATERVGVGEVFFLAGQSNMEGYYGSADPAAPQSDFVVKPTYLTQFPSNYLATPQPVFRRLTDAMGNGDNGPWVAPRSGAGRGGMAGAFAGQIVATQGVPVTIFQCAVGGTSVLVWRSAAKNGTTSTADTYLAMKNAFAYYLPHIGGIRAVLWHQGESDTGLSPSSRYTDALVDLAALSRQHAAIPDLPWLVARVSNPPNNASTRLTIQQAETEAIRLDPRIYPGPLTDDLPRASDGIHISAAGQATHGKRWADRVAETFFSTPVVSVRALSPTAIEAPATPAVFRIFRAGPAASPLTVHYTLGGTSTAGADYPASNQITIPDGQESVDLSINLAQDGANDSGENLTLTLQADPAYALKSYDPVASGLDGSSLPRQTAVVAATITLLDSPIVNLPPSVALSSPAADLKVKPGLPLFLSASATDPENAITKVSFYRDSTLIGETQTSPYFVTWASPAVGTYQLTAVVTDVGGTTATSQAVQCTVTAQATNWVSVETGGTVVIEAEHFQSQVTAGSAAWTPVSSPINWGGDGAIQCLPNASINRADSLAGPQISYPILFRRAGTYRIHMRGWAATSGDNSLHVGLDGACVTTGTTAGLSGFTSAYSWRSRGGDGSNISLNVTTPGIHNLDIWMREDGLVLDRIILTQDTQFNPEGTSTIGQEASPRVETDGEGSPQITLLPEGATLSAGGTAEFAALGKGQPPLSYSWSYENFPILSATQPALALTASAATAGYYRLRVSNSLGTAETPPVELVAVADFASWAAARAISASAMLADPDQDGVPNLLEYALGLDPANAARLANQAGLTWSGSIPAYRFTRPTGTTALSYGVEYSTDLLDWHSASAPVPVERAYGYETLVAALPAGQSRVFARLRVDRLP